MRLLFSFLFATLLWIVSFSQSDTKMRKNLTVTLLKPMAANSILFFEPKNPDKHGFDKVFESLEKSFTANGFTIAQSKPQAKYVFVLDYGYRYRIALYKMQYSDLKGKVIEVSTNEVVATMAYDGDYKNDDIAGEIVLRVKADPLFNTVTKQATQNEAVSKAGKTKEERLTELKDLFEKKLISQEEYDTQKAKILSGN